MTAQKKRPTRVMVSLAHQLGWGDRLYDILGDVGTVDFTTKDFTDLGIRPIWHTPVNGIYTVTLRDIPEDLISALAESNPA